MQDPDVVVVGAGPCGAAVAWRLALRGLRVTVLERGGPWDPAAADHAGPGWEARRAGPLHSNPNIRRGPDDEPIDDADSPIKPMLAHGVGGTSTHWSAHVPRFRPRDFRLRRRTGQGRDWPIGYADLAPYYELAEARWGTAFLPGDPSAPPRQGAPKPLPTLGAQGRRVAAAFDRLGWHWWPVDLVVGRDADAPGAARCTHAGPCDIGCPGRRRATAGAAFLDDALAAGARLMTRTRVLALETDAAGAVSALVCRTADGPTFRLHAARVVLAAGGGATPRLLLLSAGGRHPEGIGNRHGLVGRGLMLHPYAKVDGRFAEPVGGWMPGESAGLVSFEWAWMPRGAPGAGGVKLQLGVGPGPLALAEGAFGPLPGWGAAHHAAVDGLFDRILGLTVCAEDLPEEANRITLSDRLRDRDGLPAARWIYRVPDDARRALDAGMDRAEEVLREAGAVECRRTDLRAQAGFHIMGTARMGTDPGASVVDPDGVVHGVPNLVVADPSVFPSSAVINPTLTAQAHALRAADRLVARG